MRERGGIIRKLQELVRWLNRCSPVSVFNWGLALLSVPTILGFVLLESLGLVPHISTFDYSFRDKLIDGIVGGVVRVSILAGLGLWLFVAGRMVLYVTNRLRTAGRRGPAAPDGPTEFG